MKKMELEWHKIVNVDELISVEKEIRGKSGIYVWGWIDEEKSFVPYYVGKAYNLGQRLFEHVGKLKGGLYSIYSWQYAFSKNFQCLAKQEEGKLLYVPSTIENWQINFLHSTKVQESLKRLIHNLQFSWCITNKENNTDLERYIFGLLNSKKQVGSSVTGVPKEQMNVTFSGEEMLVNLCKQH